MYKSQLFFGSKKKFLAVKREHNESYTYEHTEHLFRNASTVRKMADSLGFALLSLLLVVQRRAVGRATTFTDCVRRRKSSKWMRSMGASGQYGCVCVRVW